ncbi:response regulator transcription factor [Ammonifex thiophilus]|uniref:Heme response regulator HssR n=1 Tax=Ammonifex thiophilus TaxID=444093 RepID=A0A3D8P0X6_9THEO|nr:response regulator transcription factor [Ammonifex thiophilus]RDV80728.1 DNA-binding response regulator [Ammonifex thiophilus]
MTREGTTTVLVVEDDRNIAELVSLYLEKYGFRVLTTASGAEALEILKDEAVDLVILDLMLPGIDGWEVCRQIRSSSQLPVIMLTAKGELQDKLQGFELGADDYVVKPFDPQELIARVKAVLRRAGETRPRRVDLPDLTIDLESYVVEVAGRRVELTKRETELLYFLASHPGRVFTREFLLQRVWGFEFPGNTRTVDVHVNRLREKLDGLPKSWYIKTVWGVGYKLVVGEDAAHIR